MSTKHVSYQLFWLILLCTCMMPVLSFCSDDNEYSAMPSDIQSFVARYYPEIGVSSYDFTDGVYHVTLRNSATIDFNSSMDWISINGRGSTLPQMFLYDKMPPAVYEYLETTMNLSNVYSASRNSAVITVGLTDSTLVYDIASGKITN